MANTNYGACFAIKIKTTASEKAIDILRGDKERLDKAALSAITGKIVYIGLMYCEKGNNEVISFKGKEKDILQEFWNYVNTCSNVGVSLISWYGNTFDFPFIYQRTIVNGVKLKTMFPPMESLNTFNQNKGENKLIDLGKIWSCNKFGSNNNLYDVGYACGVIPKLVYNMLIQNADHESLVNSIISNDEEKQKLAEVVIRSELTIIKTLFYLLI